MTAGDKAWGGAMWLLGIALFLAGIGCAVYQAFMWARFGYWPDIDLRDLTDTQMRYKWVGLGEVMYWFGRRSCALMGVILGVLFFRVGNSIFEGK